MDFQTRLGCDGQACMQPRQFGLEFHHLVFFFPPYIYRDIHILQHWSIWIILRATCKRNKPILWDQRKHCWPKRDLNTFGIPVRRSADWAIEPNGERRANSTNLSELQIPLGPTIFLLASQYRFIMFTTLGLKRIRDVLNMLSRLGQILLYFSQTVYYITAI